MDIVKKRIGKTIKLIYNITTNGQQVPIVGRDFTVFIYKQFNPNCKLQLPTYVDNNKLIATFEGKNQKCTGVYCSEIYENYNKNNQTVSDQIAFELVSHTKDEVTTED